jgi:hypothetical protein
MLYGTRPLFLNNYFYKGLPPPPQPLPTQNVDTLLSLVTLSQFWKKVFLGSTFQNDTPLPKFGPLIFWKGLECELPIPLSPKQINFKF